MEKEKYIDVETIRKLPGYLFQKHDEKWKKRMEKLPKKEIIRLLIITLESGDLILKNFNKLTQDLDFGGGE